MTLAIQAAGLLHQYIWSWLHPTPSKRPDALKLGVIAESYLDPATSESIPLISALHSRPGTGDGDNHARMDNNVQKQ